jgi:hypothetical protein
MAAAELVREPGWDCAYCDRSTEAGALPADRERWALDATGRLICPGCIAGGKGEWSELRPKPVPPAEDASIAANVGSAGAEEAGVGREGDRR